MNKKARICIMLLVSGLCVFAAFKKCMELYYVHYVGLSENTVIMEDVEPTMVVLPVGYVLLFVDKQERFGYVYFETREYGRADYIFVLYVNGKKTERKGRFTIWKYFPWQECAEKDRTVIVDDTEPPYVGWSKYGWLTFSYGAIDRVSVVSLSEVKNSNCSSNRIMWIKVGGAVQ